VKPRKSLVLAAVAALVAVGAMLIYRNLLFPIAVFTTLERADHAAACEMARGVGIRALESEKTGRCVDLDPSSLRQMVALLRWRILMDPIKRHTEGVCSDFVTPDSELTISGKNGALAIRLNDDRCWMSLSHALGSMQIVDPEIVKRMPSFQTAMKREAPHGV